MSIATLLAQKNVISEETSARIAERAQSGEHTLEELLLEEGVSSEDILQAKSEQYGIPIRSLDGKDIPFDVLKYIPEESVKHYGFVPLGVEDGALEVGVIDPENIGVRDALQFISSKNGMPFKLFVISNKDFQHVLGNYKSLSGEVTKALSELETEIGAVAIDATKESEADEGETGEAASRIIEDAPVTKIVATILKHAVEEHASDIHIEPLEKNVRVRYRIDGILTTSILLPRQVHDSVIARIKILAKMKLDEKRKPQDNRFFARIEGRRIDFRVSTFPTYYGEKVVMRILDSERGVFDIEDLGFTDRNLELLRTAVQSPFGMILISGPTGSGKTSTLYALLQEVDRDSKNVLSLEDPVEYQLAGVNQSQVRADIGYTFANGLRTTLRQDPDVIMVGEIRDKETAQLAVQAALTGHLVLSTIHTNSALGVIPRLVDMGVDPYLIAPTLIMTVAQRLVRTLSPDGGKEVVVDETMQKRFERLLADIPEKYRTNFTIPDKVFEAQPSEDYPKGVSGRAAVLEVFHVTEAAQEVILTDPVESKLMEVARAQGMTTMKEDALLKVFNGSIPLSEVYTLGVFDDE